MGTVVKRRRTTTPKFAWHVHHNVLIEPLTEPLSTRRAYIKEHKPKSEQALRLRLLKTVRGKLPVAYVEAWKAYDKAWKAYDEARKAYDEVWRVYDEARKAYDEARMAYQKEIKALHAKECPKCPWDGKTIFANVKL